MRCMASGFRTTRRPARRWRRRDCRATFASRSTRSRSFDKGVTMSSSIESVLTENRSFPPPAEFAKAAHIKSFADYEAMYARAASDPDGFWAEIAGELEWATRWKQVLEWKLPDAKWFIGGRLNVSVN